MSLMRIWRQIEYLRLILHRQDRIVSCYIPIGLLYINFQVLAKTSSLQVDLQIIKIKWINVECRSTDASKEAVGEDSTVICLKGLGASHGVAQDAIHSQIASQVTGHFNFHSCGYGNVLIFHTFIK
jgi:hypothetical protein